MGEDFQRDVLRPSDANKCKGWIKSERTASTECFYRDVKVTRCQDESLKSKCLYAAKDQELLELPAAAVFSTQKL